jgi:hypothetical protein
MEHVEQVEFEWHSLAMRFDFVDAPEASHQLLKRERPSGAIGREHLPFHDEGL